MTWSYVLRARHLYRSRVVGSNWVTSRWVLQLDMYESCGIGVVVLLLNPIYWNLSWSGMSLDSLP